MSFPRSFKFDRSMKRLLFTDNQILFLKASFGILGGAFIYTVYTSQGLDKLGAQIKSRADVTREGLGKLSLGEIENIQGSGGTITDASLSAPFAIKLYRQKDQEDLLAVITKPGEYIYGGGNNDNYISSVSYEWRKQKGLELYLSYYPQVDYSSNLCPGPACERFDPADSSGYDRAPPTSVYIRQDDRLFNTEDIGGVGFFIASVVIIDPNAPVPEEPEPVVPGLSTGGLVVRLYSEEDQKGDVYTMIQEGNQYWYDDTIPTWVANPKSMNFEWGNLGDYESSSSYWRLAVGTKEGKSAVYIPNKQFVNFSDDGIVGGIDYLHCRASRTPWTFYIGVLNPVRKFLITLYSEQNSGGQTYTIGGGPYYVNAWGEYRIGTADLPDGLWDAKSMRIDPQTDDGLSIKVLRWNEGLEHNFGVVGKSGIQHINFSDYGFGLFVNQSINIIEVTSYGSYHNRSSL